MKWLAAFAEMDSAEARRDANPAGVRLACIRPLPRRPEKVWRSIDMFPVDEICD
jgi:hypothetical protein